ncbi:MAG TPA: NADP-dependent oxidoreductase [Enhygromyxa sp.]|nr:NADP-dependent oxidoreductase [Enhygromyxa sp.]
MSTTRQYVLRQRPQGVLSDDALELREVALPELGANEVRVRTTHISIDPTIRIWMSDVPQYLPPIELGEVVRALGAGVVEASNHPGFAEGDAVLGFSGWQTRFQGDAQALGLHKLPPGTDPAMAMATTGMTSGMTAYFGLLDVTDPKPGETLVVDAAAGSVGSLVGQIAKIKGCRVIGIAGGADKCRYITEELGFDGAIDYRREDVGAALDRLCPNGIDICFENVGGPIFDAILMRMNLFGRVSICGLISNYDAAGTDEKVPGPYAFGMILMRRLKVQGFIILDYIPRFEQAATELIGWLSAGKLRARTHVIEGFTSLPSALRELVGGQSTNIGKMVVKL